MQLRLTPLISFLGAILSTASADGTSNWDGYKTVTLRTHSLSQPYLDSDLQSRWFDFGGDTVVRADQYIRLTSDKPSRSGWLFSRVPLTATNWEIEVEFQVTGAGALYGDGMAMWLTKERATQGDVFGSKDEFEGLGIFFDTYKNNRPGTVFPYVMAMLGDGKTKYDKDHDGKDNELAGCSARGFRNPSMATKARLTYFKDKNLVLELQYRSEEEWTQCFDISNVTIPSVAYLGFSAETGDLSDNHDIISFETRNLYATGSTKPGGRKDQHAQNVQNAYKGKPISGSKNSGSGGWGWFLIKIVLFLIACGGAYVGFTVYRSQKRGSRF